MPSIALATAVDGNAVAEVEAIAVGMKDRTATHDVVTVDRAAIAAGVDNETELIHLPTGTLVAVVAPPWVLTQLRDRLPDHHDARGDWPSLRAVFRTTYADCHAVAIVPGRGCMAYRSPMATRPLFYRASHEGLQVATVIRGLLAAAPSRVNAAGLAPFLIPQMCDPTVTAWEGIHRLQPGHLLTWHAGELCC